MIREVSAAGCHFAGSQLFTTSVPHEPRTNLHLTCTAQNCGLFNFEIDWDDGNWSSDVGSTPYSREFGHIYDTGGTYYVKFYADDDQGNFCSLEWGGQPVS
jgi:hypothetical protein